jgi:hypothetical protein
MTEALLWQLVWDACRVGSLITILQAASHSCFQYPDRLVRTVESSACLFSITGIIWIFRDSFYELFARSAYNERAMGCSVLLHLSSPKLQTWFLRSFMLEVHTKRCWLNLILLCIGPLIKTCNFYLKHFSIWHIFNETQAILFSTILMLGIFTAHFCHKSSE